MATLNWRHIVGGITLASTLLAALPPAFAQEKTGWISVNGYSSTRYRQDLNAGRNQNENTGFWGFYYAFVYNLRDIPNKVCFAGNPDLAIDALDDILNESARVDAEEKHDVQMMEYIASTDTVRFELRNRRPVNKADEEGFVKLEIGRCGKRALKQDQGLNVLTGTRTTSTLAYIFQRTFWDDRTLATLSRKLEVISLLGAREIALSNDRCIVAQQNMNYSVTKLEAGERLQVMVAADTERLEAGEVVLILKRHGDSIIHNSVGLRIECAMPSTATLGDLEQALDNVLKFER
ncbi:MAG: hypothetical protein KF767_04965 [Bdellovibrionaceae bacterium]|nr:hypothetical protein [Pseudobdellovibrionaceae bacterium]